MPLSLTRPVVLVVDDEPGILEALRRALRDEPYEIVTTQSPSEALERLAQGDVGLLIADQRMQDMRGSDLLKRAAIVAPATGRVLLTAFPEVETFLHREDLDQLITKPWRDDELRRTLHEILEHRDRRRTDTGPAVERIPACADLAESLFRIDCARRSAVRILSEIAPWTSEAETRRSGCALLLRSLGESAEPPMSLLRHLVLPLLDEGIAVTVVENTGCAAVLPEFLEQPCFLDVYCPQEGSSRRILLLGTRPEMALLEEVLALGGHDCRLVPSAEAAGRAVEAGTFDLLLADLDPLEGEAIEFSRSLQARGTPLPVVALSGGDPFLRRLARESFELRALVTKPYWLGDVFRAVEGQMPSEGSRA